MIFAWPNYHQHAMFRFMKKATPTAAAKVPTRCHNTHSLWILQKSSNTGTFWNTLRVRRYTRSYSANIASPWAGRWITWEITVSRYFSHGRCPTILHHIITYCMHLSLTCSRSVVNLVNHHHFLSMNDLLKGTLCSFLSNSDA